ncbi:MAG: CYTH domain-containing protein [Janthinobacterium lividum]
MGLEIERKFLVDPQRWEKFEKPEGKPYRQGYLVNERGKTVRIRTAGDQAFITIKGATKGFTRKEFEYEIPLEDGKELLKSFDLAGIEKTRYRVPLGGKVWEIDIFSAENEGLLVAEIELKNENDAFEKPDFLLQEVTDDPRYYNSNLVVHPYKSWK